MKRFVLVFLKHFLALTFVVTFLLGTVSVGAYFFGGPGAIIGAVLDIIVIFSFIATINEVKDEE